MAVGDQNVRHGLAFQRLLQGFEMFSIFRAGINDRNFTLPDDVDPCTDIGERAGIVRNHAADQWRHLLHDAIFKLDVANVGNCHDCLVSCSDSGRPERSALLRCKGNGKGLRHAAGRPELGTQFECHGRAHVRLVCIDDIDSSG